MVDPVVGVGLPNLWHCPACNHALGPLPGVPAHPLEPFGADVTCPECSRVISQGSILLVGAGRVEAVGKPTIKSRFAVIFVAGFCLYSAVARLPSRLRTWQTGGSHSVWDVLIDLCALVGVAGAIYFLLRTWRRWAPSSGEDRRAEVSWEMQWLASPGQIEIFDRRGGASVIKHGAAAVKREDVRSVWFEDPDAAGFVRTHAAARPVRLVLERPWQSRIFEDPVKRRSVIVLDAGADAPRDIGDRLADRVYSLVTGRAAGVADGAVSLRGRPEACRRWPKGVRGRAAWAALVTLLVCAPPLVFVSIVLSSDVVGLSFAVVLPALFVLLGAIALGLYRWLTRDLRRRWRGEAHWTVGADGVRVSTLRHEGPERSPAEMLVQSSSIGDVTIGSELGRPRIRLLDRGGAEICGLTPDTLPADGPEASRRCLLAALGLPPA